MEREITVYLTQTSFFREVFALDPINDSLDPHQRLLVAIFDRALRDHLSPAEVPQHHRRSAKKYFYTKTVEYGTFRHFCDMLGLNPDELLARIEKGNIGTALPPVNAPQWGSSEAAGWINGKLINRSK